MKRTEMINEMVEFYESIPDGASSYHKMDMLLSRIQRLEYKYHEIIFTEWEPENEEE